MNDPQLSGLCTLPRELRFLQKVPGRRSSLRRTVQENRCWRENVPPPKTEQFLWSSTSIYEFRSCEAVSVGWSGVPEATQSRDGSEQWVPWVIREPHHSAPA